MSLFADRREAGRRLATALSRHRCDDCIVLALPRGGVPVAFEVAQALHAPLDVLLVRKIGTPAFPELGAGAVVEGAQPQLVLNDDVVTAAGVPRQWIEAQMKKELAEIVRRRRMYRGDAPPPDIAGREVVLVDDGVATGGTVRAALLGLQRMNPKRVLFATPVGPAETIADLRAAADEVVCLATPPDFRAVGMHYRDFAQTGDDEVVRLLAQQAEHA
jgi:putative phosphoribosyl transferase